MAGRDTGQSGLVKRMTSRAGTSCGGQETLHWLILTAVLLLTLVIRGTVDTLMQCKMAAGGLRQGDRKYVLSTNFFLDNVTHFVREKSDVDSNVIVLDQL